MNDTKKVLGAIVRPAILARLESLKSSVEVRFEAVQNGLAFQALAWRREFDLLFAELPFSGLQPAQCLRTLRRPECASVNSPILFLADGTPDQDLLHIDRGLLSLVTTCTSLTDALSVVDKTLELRERLPVHLFAETELIVDSVRLRRVCQIENVSPTGMLLRSRRPLPLGCVVPFALRLPDDEDPIYGRGEVVRYTQQANEPVSGVGIRFFGLDGDGSSRLDGFLREQAR